MRISDWSSDVCSSDLSGEVVTAAVRNISFINPRVAQVRFVRTVTRPGNAPDDVSHWIATINIKYVDRPTTEAGRLDNPLGFQVVSYRADPEIARSEEHTSELQSLMRISYAVFCLKKKKK